MQVPIRTSFVERVVPHLTSSVSNAREIFSDGTYVLVMRLERMNIHTAIADPDIRPNGIEEDVKIMGRMLCPSNNLVVYFRFIQDVTGTHYTPLHRCVFDQAGNVVSIPSTTLAAELETKRGTQEDDPESGRAPTELPVALSDVPGETQDYDCYETDKHTRGDTGST